MFRGDELTCNIRIKLTKKENEIIAQAINAGLATTRDEVFRLAVISLDHRYDLLSQIRKENAT